MNVVKCVIKAKAHVSPVEGSVNAEEGTGTCPECLTPGVKLSKGGHIGAHAVAVEVDPTLPVVATGTPKGDPRDATVRRAVQARRIAAGAEAMPVAEHAPEGREERGTRTASSPGPAMYRGRAMTPMATEPVVYRVGEQRPPAAAPVDERAGFAGSAGTMYGPTGGEWMDREASTVPMHGGPYGYLTRGQYDDLSRTQQRGYWRKLARMTRQAAARRAQRRPVADPVDAELSRLRKIGQDA